MINQVGYDQPAFNSQTCSIVTSLKELPSDGYGHFAEEQLSDEDIDRIPVKNQVTVFGFACNQTPAYLPLPIWLAHQLARRLTMARRARLMPYLTPDGTTQVGIEYRQRRPYRIHSLTVVASQNAPATSTGPTLERLRDDVRAAVIEPGDSRGILKPDARTQIFVNPDGILLMGGPRYIPDSPGERTPLILMANTHATAARRSVARTRHRIDRIGLRRPVRREECRRSWPGGRV